MPLPSAVRRSTLAERAPMREKCVGANSCRQPCAQWTTSAPKCKRADHSSLRLSVPRCKYEPVSMTHFILSYSGDFDPWVKPFMEGDLAFEITNNIDLIDNSKISAFWSDQLSWYIFSRRIYFVSREKEIDIDFYPLADGFLVSDKFESIINKFSPSSVYTEISMLNESGLKNSVNKMKFCQITDVQQVSDLSKMDIDGKFLHDICDTRAEWL